MMLHRPHLLPTWLLTLVPSVIAQFPYNPTRLILSPGRSKVYEFSAQPSDFSFSYYDISDRLGSSSVATSITQSLPFETSNASFTPIADDDGITVLVGNCQETDRAAALWRFDLEDSGKSGAWKQFQISSANNTLTANYLPAAFSFSPTGSAQDTSLYIFGGMCPNGEENSTSWISDATYSNTMSTLSSVDDRSPYELSLAGVRAPPIPEAGLTITPLTMITANTSGKVSQQQNFVLVGGHTRGAFINMSQIALFSLPEASWSFIGINQPDNAVEPRSGHSAVLTEDGSRIIIFGGWVGDVTNPAKPQLAIIEVGQGYGGSSSWQWSTPSQNAIPYPSGQGIYGHDAVMLPGNVMMVVGGSSINSAKRKRSTQVNMFYNVNTDKWTSSYTNTSPQSGNESRGLKPSSKAGLGAGLGLGLTSVILVVVIWLLYRKRLRQKRAAREKHLELAFGPERYQSTSRAGSRVSGVGMRSASWASRQERQVGSGGFAFPWASNVQRSNSDSQHSEENDKTTGVEITGVEVEVPSPTRGLRKSLSNRGSATYGNHSHGSAAGRGTVFRIDEVEEEGSIRSGHSRQAAESRMSDPFKDPPILAPTTPAEERKREVKGWVEDWQSAAESMNLSRNPSHARTYSNLSRKHSDSRSSSYRTGRESPEKSDRTGSNLSERSTFSIQRSTAGTIKRQFSQRSISAGYTLFAGAAAAMSRLGGSSRETALERSASKRSVSINSSQPRRTVSGSRGNNNGETRSLLQDRLLAKSSNQYDIRSPPDSPIKDYKNDARTSSLTSQKKKMGVLGSVKRVFTGTSQVDVQAHVEHYEDVTEETRAELGEPEMKERENPGAGFWRGQKGAKDWDAAEQENARPSSSRTATTTGNKRRSTLEGVTADDYDGEDWDVETAVQKRVVQVMFTVPKEKLRVVNADALSLMSRSDVDEREKDERKADLKRMDSLSEDQEDEGRPGDVDKGKRRETDGSTDR